jgi:multidrug efflux pump
MVLSEVCIRRPVLATVLSLVLILLGLVSFDRLSVREYPKIDEPVVTVTTLYRGASAEIIESQVTKPLEDSIAGIEGIDTITSYSRPERSLIMVRFRLDRESDGAAADVRDRVSRVRQRLPIGVDEPTIAKVEADANPIIWLSFSSQTASAMEMTDIANRFIKTRLQTLPGAAEVRVFGERKFSMRIWLDRERLAGYRLTVQDVEDALRRQNIDVPSGRIESEQREFTVVSQTDLRSVAEFNDMVIRTVGGYPVRLRDIGRAAIAPLDERVSVSFRGESGVSIGLIKQATANPLVLSRALREELPKIRTELPAGFQLGIAYDSTVFIERSIESVYKTIAEAVVLVALVIFFFLRSVRASLIPMVTIPVCLVGAFSVMYFAGFSINTLTLLSLVLAIGLVVDDAIVVLENIYRHIEEGMQPIAAAFRGIKEVGFAVVAMTLTLAAVYAPMAFTTGRTGRLFIEFALTLAGAVLISGFVALTLSPMMCSRLLKHEPNPGRINRAIEAMLVGITRGYQRLLAAILSLPAWVRLVSMLVTFGLVGVALVHLWNTTKKELSPVEDRAVILGIFTSPEGASVSYTERHAQMIQSLSSTVPEADRMMAVSGNPTATQGIVFFRLSDWGDRKRSAQDIMRELQPKMLGIPGVTAFATMPPSLGQSPRARPINMVILSSESYEDIQATLKPLMAELQAWPGAQGVDSDLRLNKPEIRVSIDRDRAADAGVPVEVIGRTLETMLGGRQVTRFKRDGEQYDVIVQLEAASRNSPQDISNIFVRGRGEAMVPLASLVRTTETVSARELNHFGQRRAVFITGNLAPGTSLGEALDFFEDAARRHLKPGYAIDYNGTSREFKQSSSTLFVTFLLALAFIYLVLAAQFESFIDPLIIILSVPLSMAGALWLLQYGGGTINVYSQIGLITLVGLITKHGILIVEFGNQVRDRGVALIPATVEAASLRLRPIMMTTGAMVLGAVPLALATGAGAESRVQIGLVIVGGMSLGTVLTLFVVPVVYTLMARQRKPMPSEGGAHPSAPDQGEAVQGTTASGGHAAHGQAGIPAPGPAATAL